MKNLNKELNNINNELNRIADQYHLGIELQELIDKKSELALKTKLQSLDSKCLSKVQSDAINNIINYCVNNNIKVNVSNGINYLEESEDIEIQNQIDVSFNTTGFNLTAFFFGSEDKKIAFDSLVQFNELDKFIFEVINKEFKQIKDNPFRDLYYTEEDNTISSFNEIDFNCVDDSFLDKINKYINSEFVNKLIRLSDMSKEEIYIELGISNKD